MVISFIVQTSHEFKSSVAVMLFLNACTCSFCVPYLREDKDKDLTFQVPLMVTDVPSMGLRSGTLCLRCVNFYLS